MVTSNRHERVYPATSESGHEPALTELVVQLPALGAVAVDVQDHLFCPRQDGHLRRRQPAARGSDKMVKSGGGGGWVAGGQTTEKN